MAAANEWILPAEGADETHQKGYESESWLTRNILTALTRKAEVANNQI